MMVALGKDGIKTVEDLAGCATDDLVGWTERKGGEVEKHGGTLDGFDLGRTDAEAIIMAARVAAGWIEAPAEVEAEEGEAASDDD
jgi:N utilization substance protein A